MQRVSRLSAILFAVSLLVLAAGPAAAQWPAPPGGTEMGCGSSLTPEDVARRAQQLAGPQPTPPPELLSQTTYCVPIAAHIVRRSDGTGGLTITQYQQALSDANNLYAANGSAIQFYTLGIDYIDNDFYYSGIQTQSDIDMLRSQDVVTDAVNVYFTPTLPGLCGISSFTFSSVQGVVMNNSCTGTPEYPSVLAHELGHYFNLYHTHETAFGVEYVNESNCSTAGDLLCDTPADPGLSSSNVSPYPGCLYTGTAVDPNGDPYAPDPHQIMSYSRSQCCDTFSPMSVAKADNTLITYRSSLLSRGCTPVPAPTVSEVVPPRGFTDQTLDVVLVGTSLGTYTSVKMGSGVTVNTLTSLSADSLQANVTVATTAAIGYRNVVVNNAFTPDTLFAGFQVKGTPVHYVSPSGGAVYPYAAPEDAATTIAAAVSAAVAGDSVLVDSTTVNNVSLIIDKPITLSGGWTNGFTTRDVASKKTMLRLSSNILLAASTGTATIDGFALRNGLGTNDITPVNGSYGGGIRIVNTTAVVTNCEVMACNATAGNGFGGGGGIYAGGSTVAIADNTLRGNTATRGGGLYLYDCSGSVTDNVIENNAVAASISPSMPAQGAGIAVHQCTALVLTGNTVSGNTGAADGGGLWMLGSNGVTVSGGTFTGHTVSGNGGGAFVSASSVTLDGVKIAQNTSLGTFGGGLAAQDTCTTTLSECELTGNTGKIGGGFYASAGSLDVAHCTIAGNTGSIIGGAAYVASTTGQLVGNTLYDNSGGGLQLTSAPMDVFDNIVSSSTGNGIACSGTVPSLSYNLVWGSSGADWSGCSPGTGSLSAGPLFVDAAGGDFHLALNSPAIDAGDPAPAWNDPDGSRGDMGRYGSHAFVMDQPSYPKNVVVDVSASQTVIHWDRNPESDVALYAVYCDTTSGFTPSASLLVGTTADTLLVMPALTDTLYCRVSAVDTAGYAGGYSAEVASVPSGATGIGTRPVLTDRLEQNIPNPFNPVTTIVYSIANRAHVRLRIYDVSGRVVRTLVDDARAPSVYHVVWNGRNDSGQSVASGVYFYRLEAGAFIRTRKMVLLK